MKRKPNKQHQNHLIEEKREIMKLCIGKTMIIQLRLILLYCNGKLITKEILTALLEKT